MFRWNVEASSQSGERELIGNLTTKVLFAALYAVSMCSAAHAQQLNDQVSHQTERIIRVLSYNIHHGAGTDGRLELERIAKVIRESEADIVALQEVDNACKRSQGVDQAEWLAKRLKMNHAFGANIELQGGHYGNAVLSRFKILDSKNHLLPNVKNGEQRGVLLASIEFRASQKPLVIFATHFDHRRDSKERIQSANAINAMLEDSNEPRLLAGDFNAFRSSETIKTLEQKWRHTSAKELATVPVSNPTRQIDFIFHRLDSSWKIVETKVIDESVASDHRAILAVLEWSPTR